MSNTTESSSARKPSKPHPKFPLTPRADGRWMKKIHGKIYYFTGDADEAFAQYETLVERLGAAPDDRLLIRDLCNQFLESKDVDLAAGQIAQRTYDGYRAVCDQIVTEFGRLKPLDDLKPQDAESLRQRITNGVGLKTQANRINCARCVFKFGIDRMILEKPFHLWLKTVPRRSLRQYRAKQPPRTMEAAEIRLMIDNAAPPLKAMILLACNAGFGNSDCSDLTPTHLDLDNGWHTFPRPKTGEPRRAKLWPETVRAIQQAMVICPKPKRGDHSDRVFLTKYGGTWVADDRKTSPLSAEFRKLAQQLGVYRPGVSFYTLRHVFETVAGGSKDQVAVNCCMGHVDESMAANYRHAIDDDRLEYVADHVHAWLFGELSGDTRPTLRVVG